MSAGSSVTPWLEYTTQCDSSGVWRVFDPAGHQVMYYGPELDGDLAPELAHAHIQEKNFELRFMADYLGVSREQYVAALAACRAEVDARVAAGAL